MASYSLDWWLDHLEGVKQTGDGWTATCPAHNDQVQSLSLKSDDSGGTLVNCFAGCSFKNIVEAVEARNGSTSRPSSISISLVSKPARDWWGDYTQTPPDFWESIGVRFKDNRIIFSWKSSKAVKIRTAGKKDFVWEGSPNPPLWPEIPQTLPREIYIAEGESDTGILRFIGLPAWGVTKGAKTPMNTVWPALRSRGVEVVYLVPDDDQAGSEGAQNFQSGAISNGMKAYILPVRDIVDPFMGEKDIRDVWRRVGNPPELLSLISSLVIKARRARSSTDRVGLDDFLMRPMSKEPWLVKDIWLLGNVGMIIGAPKMNKSYLTLDLAVSIATGTPFLGTFPVMKSGPVVIVTKEDTDEALQDRLERILIARGLGGKYDPPTRSLRLPRQTNAIPIYLDLTREYIFDEEHTQNLIEWLHDIHAIHGSVAMVVIDPVLKALPAGIDEYRASEIGSTVFSSAMAIQKAVNTSVCMVHHRPKGGEASRNPLGSVMFFAASETSMFLQGNEPDADGFIGVHGVFKSAADTIWKFKIEMPDGGYQPTVETGDRVSITPATMGADIVRLLKSETNGLTTKELCQAFEASDNAMRGLLKKLEQEGKIYSTVDDSVQKGRGKPSNVWHAST